MGHKFIKKAVGSNKGKFRHRCQAAGYRAANAACIRHFEHSRGTVGEEARLAKTLAKLRQRRQYG